MRSLGKTFALILLCITVSGCSHKTKATPPQAAQAAPIAPATTYAKNGTTPQLPPSLPVPDLPKISPPAAKPTPTEPAKPHKTTHHKPKPSTEQPTTEQGSEQASISAPAAPASTPAKEQSTNDVAANHPPTDASPIGPLSEPGESIPSPRRNQILDEINSTEKGLNDIKRPLSSDEQTTATQIRTFVTKAKDALNQEDLDAANTLVTKAKVLLAELTNE